MTRMHMRPPGQPEFFSYIDARPEKATVTTDGCVLFCGREARGLTMKRGTGGWVAIVESGHGTSAEGNVLRGSQPETTSVRMEMVAILRGLASLRTGMHAEVVTDVLLPGDWQMHHGRGTRPKIRHSEDDALYAEFCAQLERLHVEFVYLEKRKKSGNTTHMRCHKLAKQEARKLAVALGHIEDELTAKERKKRRDEQRGRLLEDQRRNDERRRRSQVASAGLRHLPECKPSPRDCDGCPDRCPVYQYEYRRKLNPLGEAL